MSTATSDAATILIDGAPMAVQVHRSSRARNYRLTIDAARGELRLSLPTQASLKKALGWAQAHEGWVRDQMASAPKRMRLAEGVTFMLEGRLICIIWDSAGPRGVTLHGNDLRVGGPRDSIGSRVLRWLKVRAKRILERETRALANSAGLHVASVGIGDPKARWGSCAASGAIRYSWRLILCPPEVREATIAHEVAHLVHLNHSPAFHVEHARLLGRDPKPARSWLKTNGTALHGINA